jgi:hypothetical protein
VSGSPARPTGGGVAGSEGAHGGQLGIISGKGEAGGQGCQFNHNQTGGAWDDGAGVQEGEWDNGNGFSIGGDGEGAEDSGDDQLGGGEMSSCPSMNRRPR